MSILVTRSRAGFGDVEDDDSEAPAIRPPTPVLPGSAVLLPYLDGLTIGTGASQVVEVSIRGALGYANGPRVLRTGAGRLIWRAAPGAGRGSLARRGTREPGTLVLRFGYPVGKLRS
jgi:hypothetical protein